MKKIILTLGLLTALLFSACEKGDEPKPSKNSNGDVCFECEIRKNTYYGSPGSHTTDTAWTEQFCGNYAEYESYYLSMNSTSTKYGTTTRYVTTCR